MSLRRPQMEPVMHRSPPPSFCPFSTGIRCVVFVHYRDMPAPPLILHSHCGRLLPRSFLCCRTFITLVQTIAAPRLNGVGGSSTSRKLPWLALCLQRGVHFRRATLCRTRIRNSLPSGSSQGTTALAKASSMLTGTANRQLCKQSVVQPRCG